jgi:hypothetical protein
MAPLHFVLLRSVPFFLTAVAYTLVYLLVPNRKVHFRHALAGGLVAATLFEAMQRVFAIYIENFPTYRQVYGTFAAVPIFLVWLYLCWVVVLFGAALTAILPKPFSAAWRGRPAGQQFYEGLEILGRARRDAAPRQDAAARGARSTRSTLRRSNASACSSAWSGSAGSRTQAGTRGCSLAAPRALTVADVYKAFVMESQSLHTDAGAEMRALHELLAAPRAGLEASMQMSVRDLYSEPPSAEEPLRRNRVLEIVSAEGAEMTCNHGNTNRFARAPDRRARRPGARCGARTRRAYRRRGAFLQGRARAARVRRLVRADPMARRAREPGLRRLQVLRYPGDGAARGCEPARARRDVRDRARQPPDHGSSSERKGRSEDPRGDPADEHGAGRTEGDGLRRDGRRAGARARAKRARIGLRLE